MPHDDQNIYRVIVTLTESAAAETLATGILDRVPPQRQIAILRALTEMLAEAFEEMVESVRAS